MRSSDRDRGGGGGTCQRHQSTGPPDIHSGYAWSYKPQSTSTYYLIHVLYYILLRAGHQGSSPTDPHCPRVSVPLFSRLVANYSRGGTTPISWSPACTCINSVAIDLSRGLSC